MWDKLALILLIIGGVNWGLVGVFEFDLVAWLFGGAASFISRAIYILVAIAALWCMTFLFRQEALTERQPQSKDSLFNRQWLNVKKSARTGQAFLHIPGCGGICCQKSNRRLSLWKRPRKNTRQN